MRTHTHGRWWGLGAMLTGAALLAACGTTPPTATSLPFPAASPTLPVAQATPSPGARNHQITFCFAGQAGALDAPTHNGAIWAGIQQSAQALAAQTTSFEIPDLVSLEKNVDHFVANGTDIFVVESSTMQPIMLTVARKHPDVYFIGFGPALDPADVLPNYANLTFAEDQAGFLAGALAAQITKTRKVGAIIGFSALPQSWRSGEGYRAGVRYIDPAIAATIEYHDDVDIVRAFSDPAWGQAHAQRQLTNGSDVLFTDSSGTGNGALTAVAAYQQQSGQRVFAIGTDHDQYAELPDTHAVLVSSTLYNIGPGVAQLLQSIRAGTFRGGNHLGEVGLAPFHDLVDQVPAAAQARLQQIARSLTEGSLKTEVSPSKNAPPLIPVLVLSTERGGPAAWGAGPPPTYLLCRPDPRRRTRRFTHSAYPNRAWQREAQPTQSVRYC